MRGRDHSNLLKLHVVNVHGVFALAFQDGATPETIVQRYSTLALPDVYAVLAYYLRHPNEVEEYLVRREQKADEVRQRIESQQVNLSEIRARLLTQRRA